jgi:4'-phosphopantetheinyl transferase
LQEWYWPPAAEHGRLPAPSEWIDCWAVALEDLPEGVDCEIFALLSPDERRRAARFRFDHHRWRYVRAHAALRLLIERYTGRPAQEAIIVAERNGRPVLGHPLGGPHFNLSHSGTVALMAFTFAAPVGIDVEEIRPVPDFTDLARRYFAAREVAELLALAQDRSLSGFFATWTRKEAFVKALGLGLSYPLDAFETGPPNGSPSLARASGAAYDDWSLSELRPASCVIGAVAIGRSKIGIRCQRAGWPWLIEGL